MAVITVNPDFNIWQIVLLAGVDPVYPNVSYTYANGELTVPGVSQEALESALQQYDHAAFVRDMNIINNAESPLERIARLTEQISILDERTIGMQDIDFFTLQQTTNLDERTQGMQDIDQFTLDQVIQMQGDIGTLKGGA